MEAEQSEGVIARLETGRELTTPAVILCSLCSCLTPGRAATERALTGHVGQIPLNVLLCNSSGSQIAAEQSFCLCICAKGILVVSVACCT